MLNRTSCPNALLLSAKDIDLWKLKPEQICLDNGANVFLYRSQTTELIKIDFFFESGTIFQEKFFEAAAANYLISEGTRSKKAKDIADYLDFRGAYIEKNLDKDVASISIYMLRKYAADLLPLLSEIVYEPAYEKVELDIYIQKRKQQFLIDNQKVNFVASNRFPGMIFGQQHPYGKYGEYKDFDLLDTADIHNFHAKHYQSGCSKILAAGAIDDSIILLLNRYFGSRKIVKKENVVNVPYFQIMGQKDHIEMSGTVQSAIRVGKECIHIYHPDICKLMILNTILGGYFGSRLMKNIREDKGYTYGIYSGIHSFRKASMFVIAAEVDSDVAEKAVDEIRHELKNLRTTPIPTNELESVKNYLIGDFIRSMDGVFELSEKYKSILLLPKTENNYQNYTQTLMSVKTEELQQMAEKYLHEDSMCELSVGNLIK